MLLAESQRGYRNLCRVISGRHLDAGFDLVAAAGRYQEGLIVVGYDRETFGGRCGRWWMGSGCMRGVRRLSRRDGHWVWDCSPWRGGRIV